jgi:hypothetical protein
MNYYLVPELAALAPMIPPMDFADVAAVRARYAQMSAGLPEYQSGQPLTVTDVTISGGRGTADIPGRIYAPAGIASPVPALIYLHAGGFVIGHLESGDRTGRIIADQAGAVVLVLDYRLAPEHPYPASLDDCYAALNWITSAAAARHGIDTGPAIPPFPSFRHSVCIVVAQRGQRRSPILCTRHVASAIIPAMTVDGEAAQHHPNQKSDNRERDVMPATRLRVVLAEDDILLRERWPPCSSATVSR